MKNRLLGVIAKSVYLLVFFLFVGASASVGLYYYTDREMRKELLVQAKLLARVANAEQIKALTGTPADFKSLDYLKMRNQFGAIRAANPKCRFAYLMGRRADGTLFFFLDVQDDSLERAAASQPGDVYSAKDATAELVASFANGSPFVEGPVSDGWGTWISALVPVIDRTTGRCVAVVGMDFTAREWRWDVMARAAVPVAFVLFVLIGLVVVLASSIRSSGIPRPVLRRLFPVLAILLIALFGIAGVLSWRLHGTALREQTERRATDVLRDLQFCLKDQVQELSAAIHTIARDDRVRAALRSGDKTRLMADWRALFETLQRENGLAYFYFSDANRVCLVRIDQPEKFGERIDTFSIREAERTRKAASGIDMGLRGTPVLRLVKPVFDGKTVLGYVGVGKEIEEILQAFRARHSGTELAILMRKNMLDRKIWAAGRQLLGREDDWDRLPGNVVIFASQGRVPDAFAAWADPTPQSGLARRTVDREISDGGKSWRFAISPLKDSFGTEVGDLLIMNDITALNSAFTRDRILTDTAGVVFLTTLLAMIFVLLRRTDASLSLQQAKLRESEELLAQAREIAQIGSWKVDFKTSRFLWSKGSHRIFGREPEAFDEITYPDFLEFVHPDDRVAADAVYSRSLRDGKNQYEIEYRIVRPDTGEVRYIHGQYAHVRDAAGTVIQTTGMVQDVTERKLAEAKLRQSEETFHSLFDSMTEMVVLHELVFDDRGQAVNYRLTACNPAFTKVIGIEAEAAVGKLATEVYKMGAAPYLAEYAHVALTGEVKTFFTHFQPLNKSFEVSVFSPKKNFFATVSNDITERTRAETHREMVHEVLQVLNEPGDFHESIQHMLALVKTRMEVDAVGLRLEEGEDFPYFAQDGFSDDFLRTENSLFECDAEGSICRDAAGKVRLECTCGLVLSGKTDPSSPLFTKGGSFWTNDSFTILDLPLDQDPRNRPRNTCMYEGYASMALVPIRTKDRIVGLLHLNAKRKDCFNLGTVELLEGVAAHIGSALMRKQWEKDLMESETRFKALHNASFGGIAIHDKGLILDCNRGLSDITGYSFEELIGMDGLLLIAEQSRKTVMDHILEGYEKPYEAIGLRKNGKEYPVRLEGRNIPYRDRMARSVEFRDISEQKRSEAEQKRLEAQLIASQKMESVGRLAGGVAHDFNNMLQATLGYTELALEQVPPGTPLHEDLEAIKNVAHHSAQLTQQLLAFARRQVVAPKVIDLNSTIEALFTMLRRLIGEGIDMAFRPGDDLWPVKMDPVQIDQILANLCVNARDAITGVGMIGIETSNLSFDDESRVLHADYVPGDYVLLSVSDTGCGMDAETRAQVFEPFFSTKEFGKGTGLGLATVYGAVKQNHGFINVYSEPGQGSVFKIYLPRHAPDPTAEAAPEEERSSVAMHGTETVLLVEDDAVILKATTRMLAGLGYTVLAANTPAEAIRLVEENPGRADLLLSDVVMPKMNGHDLAKHLVSLSPTLKCLFMSGYTADVIAHQGLLDEHVHFLQKPFSSEKLGAKLRETLDG